MKLEGGAHKAPIVGLEKLPGITNYFIGNDPKQWHTDIPQYAAIRQENIYPGIDLVWYSRAHQFEYDFVVKPGADPNRIRVAYEGADSVNIDRQGELVVHTAAGDLRQRSPRVYQEMGGKQIEIAARYSIGTAGRVTFALAAYDHKRELRIDPMVLVYATYVGGGGQDWPTGVAVDSTGSAYVTGWTTSDDLSTPSGYQSAYHGQRDVFVAKLTPAGTAITYCTYLGGSNDEEGVAIAVDALGSAYITGVTGSSDFPVQPAQGLQGRGGYLTKLSPAGDALVYSEHLPSGMDQPTALALDASGSAYIAGGTASVFLTPVAAFQKVNRGGTDAFVAKISPSGGSVLYATYLGGNDYDFATAIAVDATGSAYIAGSTRSTNFPTRSAYQSTAPAGLNGFISKLTPGGDALVYSTYLGGNDQDSIDGIAVDSSGSAYVTGYTISADFPTVSAYQPMPPDLGNAFVTKLTPEGSSLVYSTFLSAPGSTSGGKIAVDAAGYAYVLGSNSSSSFPLLYPIPSVPPGAVEVVFVTKLSQAGNALVYSTYVGTSDYEAVGDIAVDAAGAVYVACYTQSGLLPTQSSYGGNGDAFVEKISSLNSDAVVNLSMSGGGAVSGQSIELPVQIAASNGALPAFLQADLVFDASMLTFDSARAGSQLTAAGKSIVSSTLPDGTVRLTASGSSLSPITSGPAAYATFTLAAAFDGGGSPVQMKSCVVTDALMNALPGGCSGATVSATTCDLNRDGKTDVTDLQRSIGEILGTMKPAHDVNHDGIMSVLDFQKLLQAALGFACAY